MSKFCIWLCFTFGKIYPIGSQANLECFHACVISILPQFCKHSSYPLGPSTKECHGLFIGKNCLDDQGEHLPESKKLEFWHWNTTSAQKLKHAFKVGLFLRNLKGFQYKNHSQIFCTSALKKTQPTKRKILK